MTDCPIRAIPNVANSDNLVHENGVVGSWIRPEDLNLYEHLIDTIEFDFLEIQVIEEDDFFC